MDTFQDLHSKHNQMYCATYLKKIYAETRPKSKLRIYGVLAIIRRNARGYPDRAGVVREEIIERDLGILQQLLQSESDFGQDFLELQTRYGVRFHKGADCADPRLRNSSKSFGRCFFHTHAKSEVCHLGLETEEANGA